MDNQNDEERTPPQKERMVAPAKFMATGESEGVHASFTADQVATAFEVEVERVRRAMEGEFGLAANAQLNSRQAQQLAEVILGDLPLDRRQAALLQLGAYAPRFDYAEASAEEKAEGEQSDRIRPSEEVPDIGAPRDVEG